MDCRAFLPVCGVFSSEIVLLGPTYSNKESVLPNRKVVLVALQMVDNAIMVQQFELGLLPRILIVTIWAVGRSCFFLWRGRRWWWFYRRLAGFCT